MIERERRMVERRIKQARFPTIKSLDSFDFLAMPSLNKVLVMELARCEYIQRRANIIALGNSGNRENPYCVGIGPGRLSAGVGGWLHHCASLVHQLMEARDEKQLQRFQSQLSKHKLLIIDELGFVPLVQNGG
ncbi:putative IS20 family transposase IstB-like protein [Magnetofaba australis IT-1]|uniref:Putative IS20 family transposase IstB-like protein n=1 Tax=Magnetofaba australis IT-1 TaxID=1434232 RepID=A0A1Y2KA97_9PROT|nr:putative IS20 family transposase IstB-like protein [Magnetofaba australis IT-1]